MIDCRRWLSITSSSTIPIWWLSFWRIWRYDVLQYDVVYSVMPMHFRVLYFPNFFRTYKKPVKFQLAKFFRKTKKRKMHRHGRMRNFISVLLSHWTSKTIQASNWDSAPTQFYLSWCLQPVWYIPWSAFCMHSMYYPVMVTTQVPDISNSSNTYCSTASTHEVID